MKFFQLCNGRHIMPTEDYIFETIENVKDLDGMAEIVHAKLKGVDMVGIYVTGLTVALTVVINYCIVNRIPLYLFHYDRESESYYKQEILTTEWDSLLEEAGYI